MRMRTLSKGLSIVLVLPLLALWSGVARAAGDYDAGARKSLFCAYCHGVDGNPVETGVPRLAGVKAEQLIARIRYLEESGGMHHAMMRAFIAGRLSDADVADLATYFSRQQARVGSHAAPASSTSE